MRLAIISTPRSGNSWVRFVLCHALDLQAVAVHNPHDIPDNLPKRTILQLHWYREPNFQQYLRTNEFRVLVLSRHPLDVLVSAWHFVPHEPLTARWLEGNAELPADVSRHPPASREFLSYATSWGAENLLSISYQWWHERTAIRIRYEDLVRDPVRCFGDLVKALGGSSERVVEAVNEHGLGMFQALHNRHGWRGTPGLWRSIVTPTIAFQVWRRHRYFFKGLGYGCPINVISRRRAVANWERLR